MASWLRLFQFINHIWWVTLSIALLSFFVGIYNIKEYINYKDDGCKVVKGEKRKAIFEKLKEITKKENFFLAVGGIILLAFAVNIVELGCSLGLPVIYTQILSLSNLSISQYYLYLLLYIFIFMLDDLIVFFISMITLEATGVTTKYTKISHLIGGLAMISMGLWLAMKAMPLL